MADPQRKIKPGRRGLEDIRADDARGELSDVVKAFDEFFRCHAQEITAAIHFLERVSSRTFEDYRQATHVYFIHVLHHLRHADEIDQSTANELAIRDINAQTSLIKELARKRHRSKSKMQIRYAKNDANAWRHEQWTLTHYIIEQYWPQFAKYFPKE